MRPDEFRAWVDVLINAYDRAHPLTRLDAEFRDVDAPAKWVDLWATMIEASTPRQRQLATGLLTLHRDNRVSVN